MTGPFSIRLDPGIVDRLRRRTAHVPGATASALARRLVDEGLRQSEHPGIELKDGPSGRRAALDLGPDVWEVVRVLREVDERGETAIDAAAELLHLTPARIRAAVRYYGDYPAEIETEIAEADAVSTAAEHAWRVQQQLLA